MMEEIGYSSSNCKYTGTEVYKCPVGVITYYAPSVWYKILSVLASLAGAGFWISNVMSIKETVKVVMPLKVASVICETYVAIYAIVAVFSNLEVVTNAPELATLTGFLGFAFVAMAVTAWIISKTTGKKQASEALANVPKTDEELRAEIEEKVRREMIEKEVRAKMEAEMSGQESVPEEPVQDSVVSEEITMSEAPMPEEPVQEEPPVDGESQGMGLGPDGQF